MHDAIKTLVNLKTPAPKAGVFFCPHNDKEAFMQGESLHAVPKKTLNDAMKKSTLCWNHTDYIDKNYGVIAQKKKDIMVGFGFVSFKYGLSEGVPIDIYNMLLAAEDIRRQVLEPGAKVHVLIGDHLAYQCQHSSCERGDDVTKTRNKYIKKIYNILKNLKVEKHYELQLSSEIIKDPNYLKIREDLEVRAKFISTFELENATHPKYRVSQDAKHTVSTDTWNILNCIAPYNESNRSYFLDQTAICRWLYEKSNCGVKVSWSKVHQTGRINQSKSFDEPHFDRFYREMYFDEDQKLSFIYTKPGYAINRNDERGKVIPYTAQKDEETQRVLLSSKKELPQKSEVINEYFINCITSNVDLIRHIVPEVAYEEDRSMPTFNKNVHLLVNFSRKPEKLAKLSDIFKEKLTVSVDKAQQHQKDDLNQGKTESLIV